MKKKEVALAIFLLTGLTLQAQERVTQYKVRDAIEVRTPIMNDSINPKGEKHSTKMLLKTPVVLDLPDAPLQSLTVDTAGYLTLDKADKNSKIYVLKTQIRAERFLKGKLKVTSPVRWEVFIDEVSKQTKDAAEDSISSASSRDIALTLEPERDYEITIKLLSTAEDKAAPTLKCEFIKDNKFKDIACTLYSVRHPCYLSCDLSEWKIPADPLLEQPCCQTLAYILSAHGTENRKGSFG